MKRYGQLVKDLPTKTVVFAFGRFQPPTNGHALLVSAVTKLASAKGADHVIYASRSHDKKSNPLPVDRKVYYLKRMFPRVNFVAANEEVRTFIEAAKILSGKYKNLIMIAGSDRVPEYKKLLDKYNGDVFTFDDIQVISAGERDPDSDTAAGMSGTKMREAAKKGDFAAFKKGLPHTLTELDGKRLMNEIREGMGIEAIKESIRLERNTIREKYHAKEIFNVGDKVLFKEQVCEIVKRGTNHVLVQLPDCSIESSWLDNISIYEDIEKGDIHNKELQFAGYTTKNFHHSEDAIKAFIDTIKRNQDTAAILAALKATDAYMGMNDRAISGDKLNDQEKEEWLKQHEIARDMLNKIGEFAHHQDYWHMHQHEIEDTYSTYAADAAEIEEGFNQMKYTSTDKLKVAKVIATSLGYDPESSNNPELLVNTALRRVKNKPLSPQSKQIVQNMLKLAANVGIKFDPNIMKLDIQDATEESTVGSSMHDDPIIRKLKIKHHLGEEKEEEDEDEEDELEDDENENEDDEENEAEDDDLEDDDIEDMIDSMDDDEFLHAYDDEELVIVDDETGEEVDDLKEEIINEVLTRAERIKSKIRFARTKSKRERKLRIALKTRSSTSKINSRARRLAVKSLKQRIAKRPLDTLSVSEKERLERIVQKRKKTINRIAMKMVPKIRRIENDRLVHHSYTK